MLEKADRLTELARIGRWAAFQARQDVVVDAQGVSTQLERLGKEEDFRRRYVASMLPIILAGAMEHARPEMGNIQVCGSGGSLQICA